MKSVHCVGKEMKAEKQIERKERKIERKRGKGFTKPNYQRFGFDKKHSD